MLSEMLFEFEVAGNFCSGTRNKTPEGLFQKLGTKIPATIRNILVSGNP